jgi:hypothetical protein
MRTLARIGVALGLGMASAALAQTSGPEFRLSTSALGSQSSPDVASGPTRFLVTWLGQGTTSGGAKTGIMARRYTIDVASPLAEEQLDDDLATQYHPARVASGSGFLAVWGESRGDAAGLDIWARRVSYNDGALGSPFRVNATTAGIQGHPAVTGDYVFGYVVVWESPDGDGTGIYAQRFTIQGAPLGGEFRVNTTTTNSQTQPAVSFTRYDDFVVAWTGPSVADTTGLNVYMQRFDSSGAKLGAEVRVHDELDGDQSHPAIGSENSGDFVVVWQGPDGDQNGIFRRKYASDGTPGTQIRVNTATAGDQSAPDIAMNDFGFLVTWADTERASGGTYDVAAKRYDGSNAPVGATFTVNTYTTGDSDASRATLLRDGAGYVVVWQNDVEDGSGSGVYGRKVCLSGDANNDGSVSVADVFYLINYLFAGGAAPSGCADVNGSFSVDVSDVFYLINAIFAGGPAPQ